MKKTLLSLREMILMIYIVLNIACMKIYYSNSILLVLFFSYLILSIKRIKISKKATAVIVLILIAYFIPSLIFGQFTNGIKMFCKIICIISPILIYYIESKFFHDENTYEKFHKYKSIFVLELICFFAINMYFLNSNPYFARNMANYNYDIPGVSGLALFSGGGYYIIYGLLFFSIYLLNNCHYEKNVLNKIIFLISYILICIWIFKSNFATAFILLIIGAIIYIITVGTKKTKIFNIILGIIIIICGFNYDAIILNISQLFPSDSIIYIRINDAVNHSDTSTFSERLQLMEKSFESIKDNYLFGLSHKYGYNYNELKAYVGLHTEWIDFIAKYGIIMFAIYVYILARAFKEIMNNYKNTNYYNVFLTSAILLTILGFLNPISNTGSYFIIFQIIPIFIGGRGECIRHEKNV